MTRDDPVTLMPFPRRGANPYTELLYRHLEAAGVRVLDDGRYWRRRLLDRAPDYVHYHWPGPMYGHHLRWRLPDRALRFFGRLKLMRRLGTQIVWTFHNALPHERVAEGFHRRARRWMVDHSDLILVNFRAAADHLARTYGRTERVFHVPHGSYAGWYPADRSRAEARARLGVPDDAFVFLVFGELRPYKNVTGIIEAFGRLDDPRARLVIAGGARDPAYEAEVRARAAADPRVVLHARRIDEADVQDYFRGADILVLGRPVFSSGTAVLAMDFGLPVLASPENHVAEVARGAALVPLPDPSPDGLLDGLRRARTIDREAARRSAAEASAALAWQPIADRLAEILRAERQPRRGAPR